MAPVNSSRALADKYPTKPPKWPGTKIKADFINLTMSDSDSKGKISTIKGEKEDPDLSTVDKNSDDPYGEPNQATKMHGACPFQSTHLVWLCCSSQLIYWDFFLVEFSSPVHLDLVLQIFESKLFKGGLEFSSRKHLSKSIHDYLFGGHVFDDDLAPANLLP